MLDVEDFLPCRRRRREDAQRVAEFREALKFAYYGMQEARDRYRAGTASVGMSEALIRQWVEWQALVMVPITPHWCEEVWEMLGKPGLAVTSRWPTPVSPGSTARSVTSRSGATPSRGAEP